MRQFLMEKWGLRHLLVTYGRACWWRAGESLAGGIRWTLRLSHILHLEPDRRGYRCALLAHWELGRTDSMRYGWGDKGIRRRDACPRSGPRPWRR